MSKIKLKVEVSGFVHIDPQDFVDEFCEENDIDQDDGDDVDEEALATFAIAQFTKSMEDGDDPEVDDPSISVTRVEEV